MKGMLLSNLDASTSPYHQGPEDGLPWFAILNADYSPRPAWSAFKEYTASMQPRQPTVNAVIPPQGGEDESPAEATDTSDSTGQTVRVANTDGSGVSLRDKPSLAGKRLTVVPEGTRMQIVSADVQADGHTWRNVKTPGGAAGWVAGEYVKNE
jgi:hypothetical protein